MPVSMKKQRGFPGSVQRFRTMDEFVEACKAGKVPEGLFSPGFIAAEFGLHRQTVHDAVWAGRVEAWYVEGGYLWVGYDSAARYWPDGPKQGKVRS